MNLDKFVAKYRALFKSKPPVLTAHESNGPHFYVDPKTGEKFHSVTYYSTTLKNPSLTNWKMNRALDFLKEELSHTAWAVGDKPEELYERAKLAPEGIFQNAGFVGVATHKFLEDHFKAWIDSGTGSLPPEEMEGWELPVGAEPEVISGCRAIKKFLKDTGAIPIAVELPLVDDELKVGGQIDALVVFPNSYKDFVATENNDPLAGGYRLKQKPYLAFIDLKTSSQGNQPGFCFQVRGFYQRMIWKTYHVRPKKTYILHTSKNNGEYKLIDLTDMKFLEKDVQHLVELSRSWDKVAEALKPKIITI